MYYSNGKPIILDQHGRPANRTRDGAAAPGGIALPTGWMFVARLTGGDNTLWLDRFDEAMRHSRDDARSMRADVHLMRLLEERIRAVVTLPWELEIADEVDPRQVKIRDALARQIKSIPFLTRILWGMLEAIWYGRAGVQVEWAWKVDRGLKYMVPVDQYPITGDSLGHQEDGTPYLLVNPSKASELPPAQIITTQIGLSGLRLTGTWRDRFLLHKHIQEARDPFAYDEAEAIHGVGVRSKIFWAHWLKLEWLSNITDFFSRVGMGINVWKYESGNDAALRAVQEVAKDNTDRANIFVPVTPDGATRGIQGVERVEVPTSGAQFLRELIEYLDRQIETYVVGQEASSKGSSSGLGNEANADFQQDTKKQIAMIDGAWLAESLTGSPRCPSLLNQMAWWFCHVNRDVLGGELDFPINWKFKIGSTQSDQQLGAIKTLVELGVKVKADDARMAAGVSKPAEGDEEIKPPQQGMPGSPGGGAGGGNPLEALLGGGGGSGGAPPEAPGEQGGAPPAPGGPPPEPPGGAEAPSGGEEPPEAPLDPASLPDSGPGSFLKMLLESKGGDGASQFAREGALRYEWTDINPKTGGAGNVPTSRQRGGKVKAWYGIGTDAGKGVRYQISAPGSGRGQKQEGQPGQPAADPVETAKNALASLDKDNLDAGTVAKVKEAIGQMTVAQIKKLKTALKIKGGSSLRKADLARHTQEAAIAKQTGQAPPPVPPSAPKPANEADIKALEPHLARGMNASQLMNATRLSRPRVMEALGHLMAAGKAEIDDSGRFKRYLAKQEGATETAPEAPAEQPKPQLPASPKPGQPVSSSGATPPVAPGMVRFYHGANSGKPGDWVTPDLAYAQGYAEKTGGTKAVFYIDIPESSPLLQKAYDDEGLSQKAPWQSFQLPPEIARKLAPYKQAEQESSATPQGKPPEAPRTPAPQAEQPKAPEPTPEPQAGQHFQLDQTLSPAARQGMLKLLQGIEGSKLTPEQKHYYKTSAQNVLKVLPEKAAQRFAQHLAQAHFFGSTDAIKDGLRAWAQKVSPVNLPAVEKLNNPGGVFLGFGGAKRGYVFADGDRNVSDATAEYGGGKTAQDVYSHEFTHAIDGYYGGGKLSEMPGWQEAWQSDIKNGQGKLSEYAKKDANEGFAEFGRAVYGGKHDRQKLEQDFPAAFAFWKEQGLVPEAPSATQPGATMPEVFGAKVAMPDGHADLYLPKESPVAPEQGTAEQPPVTAPEPQKPAPQPAPEAPRAAEPAAQVPPQATKPVSLEQALAGGGPMTMRDLARATGLSKSEITQQVQKLGGKVKSDPGLGEATYQLTNPPVQKPAGKPKPAQKAPSPVQTATERVQKVLDNANAPPGAIDHALEGVKKLDEGEAGQVAKGLGLPGGSPEMVAEQIRQKIQAQQSFDPDAHVPALEAAIREHGGEHNLAPMTAIRKALAGMTPEQQVAVVNAARKQGIIGGSSLEGRHGITPEEHEAAIHEGDDRIGYLSLRPGEEKEAAPVYKPYGSGQSYADHKKAVATRAATATAQSPGKRGGAGSALRGSLRDSYDWGTGFRDNENGIVPIPLMYEHAKKAIPNLTPEEFTQELRAAWNDSSKATPEGKFEGQILNEVHRANDPHHVAWWTQKNGEDDKLIYYAYWKPPKAAIHEGDPHSAKSYRQQAEQAEKAQQAGAKPEPLAGGSNPVGMAPTTQKRPNVADKKPPTGDKAGAPHPPEPNYTGTDTLGRKWDNGKVVGEGPLNLPPTGNSTITIDPARKLNVSSLVSGPIPKVTPELVRDLEAIRLYPNQKHLYRPSLNDDAASRNPEEVKRLQAAGVLAPLYAGSGSTGPQKLTDVGALAMAKAGGLADEELADPTSIKSMEQITSLYALMGKEGRAKILDHFGIKGKDPKDYAPDVLHDELTAALEKKYNPQHVAERVRQDKNLHSFVAGLAKIETGAQKRLGELKRRESELKQQSGHTSLQEMDYAISSIKQKLAQKSTRGKEKLRQQLAELEKHHADFAAVIKEKWQAIDRQHDERHEAVAAHLRGRIKDATPVVVDPSGIDPEMQQHMQKAATLLQGVLQRSAPGVSLPPMSTYKDGDNDRAHYSHGREGGSINFQGEGRYSAVATAIHEIMHGVECHDPGIAAAIQQFRDYRVGDEQPTSLKEKFGCGFEDDEMGYKDQFEKAFEDGPSAYYVGKKYSRGSTEILSMGVEKLFTDPSGFAARDPEYCAFIVGMLDGSLRNNPIPKE